MFLSYLTHKFNASLQTSIETYPAFDEAITGLCAQVDSLIDEGRVPADISGVVIDVDRKVGVARLLHQIDFAILEEVSDGGELPSSYFADSDLDAPLIERGSRTPHRYGEWAMKLPRVSG